MARPARRTGGFIRYTVRDTRSLILMASDARPCRLAHAIVANIPHRGTQMIAMRLGHFVGAGNHLRLVPALAPRGDSFVDAVLPESVSRVGRLSCPITLLRPVSFRLVPLPGARRAGRRCLVTPAVPLP